MLAQIANICLKCANTHQNEKDRLRAKNERYEKALRIISEAIPAEEPGSVLIYTKKGLINIAKEALGLEIKNE